MRFPSMVALQNGNWAVAYGLVPSQMVKVQVSSNVDGTAWNAPLSLGFSAGTFQVWDCGCAFAF